jgi:shikimate kinase
MASIIIIGPPGSGKSTIGRQLAAKLVREFRDTDALIEEQTGEKISQIFVDRGETWFRETEMQMLEKELSESDHVLSLGGGAPLSEKAQSLLRSQVAPIIFLDVSLSTAAPRVGFNRDRPLLLSNPRATWQELMDKRRPIYETLATHTIVVDGKKPEQIVDEIIKVLA